VTQVSPKRLAASPPRSSAKPLHGRTRAFTFRRAFVLGLAVTLLCEGCSAPQSLGTTANGPAHDEGPQILSAGVPRVKMLARGAWATLDCEGEWGLTGADDLTLTALGDRPHRLVATASDGEPRQVVLPMANGGTIRERAGWIVIEPAPSGNGSATQALSGVGFRGQKLPDAYCWTLDKVQDVDMQGSCWSEPVEWTGGTIMTGCKQGTGGCVVVLTLVGGSVKHISYACGAGAFVVAAPEFFCVSPPP